VYKRQSSGRTTAESGRCGRALPDLPDGRTLDRPVQR
jgi:hypothetical protein